VIALALAVAVGSLDVSSAASMPAAPQRYCEIETRVWCLSSGDYRLEMKGDANSRVWTIVDVESSGDPVTVTESTDCYGITNYARSATTLFETLETRPGKLRTTINYAIPAERCTLAISWESSPPTASETRRSVLANISLGWPGNKESLVFVLQRACDDSKRSSDVMDGKCNDSRDPSARGVLSVWISPGSPECTFSLMDVVGLDASRLEGGLRASYDPLVGVVISAPAGAPEKCVDDARKAAAAAGFRGVTVDRVP